MNLTDIRSLIQDDLLATDELLNKTLRSDIKLIQDMGQHLIHSGGKRLRPMIVLLCAKAYNYQGSHHCDLAAIIELIHTATLLHDDVVDVSELRRGSKTANVIWGNSASILVGDYLYSRAFQLMVKIGDLPILKILAEATNTIAEGEILQLINRNNPDTTESQYMRVINTKTGALFATATQMGPILSKQSAEVVSALESYGSALGTAFQLVDDALDLCAESETLGKNQGDDIADGNPTLPVIYALQRGNESQKKFIRDAIINSNKNHLPEILSAIESTQAIAYTYQVAREYAQKAREYLNVVPKSIYKDALIALTKFSVERAY